MSLPGSYQNSFQLLEIDRQKFIDGFEVIIEDNADVKEISISEKSIQFNYQSLFGIPYQIEIKKCEIDSKTVDYEIKLNKLIMVCIALIIFIAFFSSFRFSGFLWFSGIFTIIFYILNVVIVDKYVQGILKSGPNNKDTEPDTKEKLSKQQMEWLYDNSKCPGCGEDISEYDKNCPDCGLKIREKVKPKPYDLSKYEGKNIKYFFKEKKKDKHG
jgi:hypothetical protein